MYDVSTNTGSGSLDFALALNGIAAVGDHTGDVGNGTSLALPYDDFTCVYFPLQYIPYPNRRGLPNPLGNDRKVSLRNA
jgi:hypothetical protein